MVDKAEFVRRVAEAFDVPIEMLVGKETPMTDPIEGCPDCGADVELVTDELVVVAEPEAEDVQCSNPRCGWRP